MKISAFQANSSSVYCMLNIEYPPAKLLRRSFGALAKAEVLYGGQVERGISKSRGFLRQQGIIPHLDILSASGGFSGSAV